MLQASYRRLCHHQCSSVRASAAVEFTLPRSLRCSPFLRPRVLGPSLHHLPQIRPCRPSSDLTTSEFLDISMHITSCPSLSSFDPLLSFALSATVTPRHRRVFFLASGRGCAAASILLRSSQDTIYAPCATIEPMLTFFLVGCPHFTVVVMSA